MNTIAKTLMKIMLPVLAVLSLHAYSAPRVSLITCGAGEDLYSIFGHSAVRIADSAEGYDYIFNYGMFSYNTENFFYKFVKGETFYWLGVENYEDFIGDYREDGRAVYESTLLISEIDALRIRDFLETNIKPENKVYLYSYLFDNCATRIRDLVAQSVGDTVIWQPDSKVAQSMPEGIARPLFFDSLARGTDYTYRDLLNLYLHKITWVEWGIFYSVAAPSDRLMPYTDAMFLPEFLLMGFQNAVYVRDGEVSDLVATPVELVAARPAVASQSDRYTPMMVFVILLIVVSLLSYWEWRTKRLRWGVDAVLLILQGLYGCTGFFVSIISIHPATFPNYNLLWAGPWHLIAGLLLFVPAVRRRMLSGMAYFFLTLIALYAIALLFALQALHPANIPLIGVFVLRYCLWIRGGKK